MAGSEPDSASEGTVIITVSPKTAAWLWLARFQPTPGCGIHSLLGHGGLYVCLEQPFSTDTSAVGSAAVGEEEVGASPAEAPTDQVQSGTSSRCAELPRCCLRPRPCS